MKHRPARLFKTALATALVVPLMGCGAGAALPEQAGDAKSERSGQRGGDVRQAATKQQLDTSSRSNERRYPTLTGIRVKAGDRSYDRVVFTFAGTESTNLPDHEVEYLDGYPTAPGSGKPVEMAGQHFLGVSFTHATAGENLQKVTEPVLPTVAEVRYLGGFEKVQEAAIGVTSCHGAPEQPGFDVTTRADSVVVDISAADCGAKSPKPRECGDVAFTPQSDYGAFGITATGVGCEVARDVAAFVEGRIGDPYGTPSGFACLPERDASQPTPGFDYTCTRGQAKVTFVT